jgi:hypothetical protein
MIGRLEDLREVLREAQWLMLPQKHALEMEGGRFWFVPENAQAEGFVWTLLDAQGIEAQVVVSEDALTRETVLADADGAELERLQAEEGYHPAWVLELLAMKGMEEDMGLEDYDPARVSVSVRLVPVFWDNMERTDDVWPAMARHKIFSVWQGHGVPSAPDVLGDEDFAIPLPSSTIHTNEMAMTAVNVALRIVYVDGTRGDDEWSGRLRVVAKDAEGPKRSVRGGMKVLQDGGGLVIREGIYAEGLDVCGRDVIVRFDGHVVLKKAVRAPTVFAPEVMPNVFGSTNGVAKVIQ